MNHRRLACILITSLTLFSISPAHTVRAQARPQPERIDSDCDRVGALALVQQQLSEAKGVEDTIARIEISIRAADLLWATQTERARAAFKEAYDLAEQSF